MLTWGRVVYDNDGLVAKRVIEGLLFSLGMNFEHGIFTSCCLLIHAVAKEDLGVTVYVDHEWS